MKLAFLILGTLIFSVGLLALFLYWYGRRLPLHHRQSANADLPVPPQRVWEAITRYDEMPRWWDAVKTVETESRKDGTTVTWNVDKHGQRIGFVTEATEEPRRLVRRILDEDLPFGGSWTFELERKGNGTKLTLSEDGFIRPPLFRAIAHLFIGMRATLEDFLKALAKHLVQ